MPQAKSTLRIRQKTNLDRELEAFLIDRRARGLSLGTLRFYTQKLHPLHRYLQSQGTLNVESITAPIVRRFLLEFSVTHNPGGVHAVYRAVKAFLRWYELAVHPHACREYRPTCLQEAVA